MIIRGTVRELESIIGWNQLCEIIGVDYYKRSRIGEDEQFVIQYDQPSQTYKKMFSEQVEQPEKELVGYQQRFIDDEEGPTSWSFCDENDALVYMRKQKFQVRPVYAFDLLD